MYTRAGAELQQICAETHSLIHTPCWFGAAACLALNVAASDVTSEDRKIAQLSGNLPLAAYDGAELRH